MKLDPGELVLVDFPGAQATKRRPAVVLSSSDYHDDRPDVILGVVTSQIERATAASDAALEDWRQAGLRSPSAFRAFLVTLPQWSVGARIGRLSERDWRAVQAALRAALAVG